MTASKNPFSYSVRQPFQRAFTVHALQQKFVCMVTQMTCSLEFDTHVICFNWSWNQSQSTTQHVQTLTALTCLGIKSLEIYPMIMSHTPIHLGIEHYNKELRDLDPLKHYRNAPCYNISIEVRNTQANPCEPYLQTLLPVIYS